MRDWSRAGVLGVAALLLLAGAVRVAEAGEEGWALLAAGMVLTGIWVTVELHDRWHKED